MDLDYVHKNCALDLLFPLKIPYGHWAIWWFLLVKIALKWNLGSILWIGFIRGQKRIVLENFPKNAQKWRFRGRFSGSIEAKNWQRLMFFGAEILVVYSTLIRHHPTRAISLTMSCLSLTKTYWMRIWPLEIKRKQTYQVSSSNLWLRWIWFQPISSHWQYAVASLSWHQF